MTRERQAPAAPINSALEELKAQFAENDVTMSEELKQQSPIMTFDEMAARFPNEWIAFVATAPQFRQRDAKGRVLFHAPDREALDELILPFHEVHPDLPLSTEYTGKYEYTKSLIDAVLDYRNRKD